MSEDEKVIRPINWAKLRTDEAERVIRERAASTANVLIGDHAYDRIGQRSITQVDVYRILRSGYVVEQPVRSDHGDGWKAVVVKKMPGEREAGAVTIVFDPPSDRIFVVTVEWMDIAK